MYPMYGHMDSYPHQRPYAPYYQNHEQTPYHMKPYSPKSPSQYEYYPYGFNTYYHPHPMEFHGCCNHNYVPTYHTFQPPYPHFPPPPPPAQPFYFHGNYAPHPHYPIDMPPRYDYDKNTPQDHRCCGCPSHSCTGKEKQIVKMEEPDPDSEKKTSGSLGNSLYPIVWIPPGFMKNEEEKEKSAEVGSKGKEGNENSKSDDGIRFFNGWLPLDMNKLENLMPGRDGKKVQERKEEDRQFPFSIFSVPSNPKEVESSGPKDKVLPSKLSITPVKTVGNEDFDSVQNFPKNMERPNDKGTEQKLRNIPVEFRTDVEQKKITKNSEKGMSSSSSKSSKLPPVCLRVDPLPGKKRSSRSPSPTKKGKSENSASENVKVQEKSVEIEPKLGKCVSEESNQCKDVNLAQSGEEKCEVGEKRVEIEKEESKQVKNVWCDNEAATKIQSVYRGYEVRKWDPLNKLKQVAKVKDQVAEIKCSIEALEASSADEKQKLVIGETIMSLLLKLDTIQGFHPSIRDFRKSVARQLVNLQEKLDTLITKNSIEDLSTTAAASVAEHGEPLMIQQEVNVEEQCGHGEPPESVQDMDGKSVGSTVSEDVLPSKSEEAIPIAEEIDEKVLEELDAETKVQVEIQEKGVNQEVNQSSLLKDEAAESDEVTIPLKMEEPKPEIPVTGEETVEEVLEESKVESDAQLEGANGGVDESYVTEGQAIKADEAVLPRRTAEPVIEIPIISEKTDVNFVEETKDECDLQSEETTRKVDEPSVSEGEATKADKDAVFSNTEEPAIELPVIREGDVKETLEETKAVEGVQPEEAQQNGHSEEVFGKAEKVQMQAFEKVFVRPVNDANLREENEKLKEMVEKLVEAGKEQISAISNLSGKVKDLEKKLSKKNKLKTRNRARKLRTLNYEQMVSNE